MAAITPPVLDRATPALSSGGSTPTLFSDALRLGDGSPGFSVVSFKPSYEYRPFDSRSHLKQERINAVCSAYARAKIETSLDFRERIKEVVLSVIHMGGVLKDSYSEEQCCDLFERALQVYSDAIGMKISFKGVSGDLIEIVKDRTPAARPTEEDDLDKVTKSYDKLQTARMQMRRISKALGEILEEADSPSCEAVVLGSGDSAVSIWLEKYSSEHGLTEKTLSEGVLPKVLMLSSDMGSWRHDYTLAQPYSLLERSAAAANPSDFISEKQFISNPRVNARHVYQANLVVLGKTKAPLVCGVHILKIEKISEHFSDWKSIEHFYRLKVLTPSGQKYIYTSQIDVCTGLGPAKNAFSSSIISDAELNALSSFDERRGFTPIVDGNQFILTSSEEGDKPRTIVVYGGGGTAAACYRKGFFGHDIRTEEKPFDEAHKKNTMFWISARGFGAAGLGKLATAALTSSHSRGESHIAELQKVTVMESGRLLLSFSTSSVSSSAGASGASILEISCDQLVYSIGQDDVHLKSACEEINDELALVMHPIGMPLGVASADRKVHFHGASAMAIRTAEYSAATWGWLHRDHIGPDVGPGSMPPSRAQIKCLMTTLGAPLTSVNVNIDHVVIVQEFLSRSGVPAEKVSSFIEDLLEARKESASGCCFLTLQGLLEKHSLQDSLIIRRHSHLIKK